MNGFSLYVYLLLALVVGIVIVKKVTSCILRLLLAAVIVGAMIVGAIFFSAG